MKEEDKKFRKFYKNKLDKILSKTKNIIEEDYYKVYLYLTQKQLNELYKGEPITVKAKLHQDDKPKNMSLFDFVTSDRKNLPSVLYMRLFKIDEHISKIDNKRFKYFKVKLTKEDLLVTLKEIIKINKKIDSLFKSLKDYDENEDYNIFISNLMKYSSQTPMLKNKRSKYTNLIKNELNKKKKIRKVLSNFYKYSHILFFLFPKSMS